MRRLIKQKKGQFIIIAVLLIAIMMVSIGALLYSAVTYYKHEPWEEYLTLIGNIELSSRSLVELSLSNYTHTLNTNILKANLEQWQSDIKKAYPGSGVILTYSLPGQGTKAYFRIDSYSPYAGAPTPGFTMDSKVPSGSYDTINLVDVVENGTHVWFYQSPSTYDSRVVPEGDYHATFWVQTPYDDADLYCRIKYYDSEGIKNITGVEWKTKEVDDESGITKVVFDWTAVESWTMPAGGGFVVEIYVKDVEEESDVTLYCGGADYPSHIEVPTQIPQTVLAYGLNINYTLGLSRYWYKETSFSAANATFNLNITSVGLTGYKFMTTAFLNLTILKVDSNEIDVTVTGEDGTPITNLKKDNFQVDELNIADVTSHYDPNYILVYTIKCNENIPTPVTVRVWDQRGIQVIAKKI